MQFKEIKCSRRASSVERRACRSSEAAAAVMPAGSGHCRGVKEALKLGTKGKRLCSVYVAARHAYGSRPTLSATVSAIVPATLRFQ